jgi:virulence factor Mce-like protein
VRRLATIAVVLAACGAVLVLGTAADPQSGSPEYRVELDNAFGLIQGGDFKVAGVRAGQITALDLDERTKRALVSFRIEETGFGSLRRDASCEVLPQSLVGEYYVDCQPGTAREELPVGGTIPVEQTVTVVPPDLVGNIMRRPVRERLRYILAELGAGVGGNAENLNAAIRRASPALRETNRVLRILARQNQVLADLVRNGDTVLRELAENRDDVGRFIVEAKNAASASAERDSDIAAGLQRLPEFLRQLRPTMAELGRTADAQGPALRELSRSADQLERLFGNLGPFANATRPALRSLGRAAQTGERAVRAATPTIAELNRYASGVPELGKNLAIVLEHLDDRDYSAEEDPRSPGGKGYTGLEALLQYVLDQTLSTNIYDSESHILKAFPFEGHCAAYADLERARKEEKDCSTYLGPNVIGLRHPDTTAPEGFDGADRGPAGPEDDPPPRPAPTINDPARKRSGGGLLGLPSLDQVLPPLAPTAGGDRRSAERVLDYLLGP